MILRPRIGSRAALLLGLIGAAALALPALGVAASPACGSGQATDAAVGRPGAALAWRAHVETRVPLHARFPAGRPARALKGARSTIGPQDAPWLLVLQAKRDRNARCWVRVRLPWRPNDASAWVNAQRLSLSATGWRIVVSRSARKLELRRAGKPVLRTKVVVGAPGTPTPVGLFSIVDVWRWNPTDFLGSYILALTAHSPVLQEFGGGDGRVGIHGRGGASLLDPLGSAASHGCIRLANRTIESVVRRVGADGLSGIPVRVS